MNLIISVPQEAITPVDRIVSRLLSKRQIAHRIAPASSAEHPNCALRVDHALAKDAYAISLTDDGVIEISGQCKRALLYGIGRFLRTVSFNRDGVPTLNWQGVSQPSKPFRGIYFATHFNNFYQDAPIELVQQYLEELVLWGYNAVGFWFDLHHFTSFEDPRAQAFFSHIHAMTSTARELGLDVGLLNLVNEGYSTTPEELCATHTKRSHYGVEICPATSAGMELLLAHKDQLFDAFADVGLDFLCLWPYDQGGCGCEKCQPWGANGMLKAGRQLVDCFHQHFPQAKVIFSTWLFDLWEDQGEWSGIKTAFDQDSSWVDYIMADSHGEFPEYPKKHGVPGNLPLLNFPEISMWKMWPWGGFGANPLPERFSQLWRENGHHVVGGFPYSEGLFEDLNKALCSQFYWDENASVEAILADYARLEFGCVNSALFADTIREMEKNHAPNWNPGKDPERFALPSPQPGDPRQTFARIQELDSSLPAWGRQSWRWRIIFIRALLDCELSENDGQPTPACEDAFLELEQLYYAANGNPRVKPPSQAVRERAARDIEAWKRSFNQVHICKRDIKFNE